MPLEGSYLDRIPESVDRVWQHLTGKISPHQVNAIEHYAGLGSMPINRSLRQKTKMVNRDYIAHRDLSELAQKLPKLHIPTSATRLILLPPEQVDEFINHIKKNGTYYDKAWASHSINKGFPSLMSHDGADQYKHGNRVVPVVLHNKVTNGIPFVGHTEHPIFGKGISPLEHEQEFLLPPESHIKVNDIEPNGEITYNSRRKPLKMKAHIIHGTQI